MKVAIIGHGFVGKAVDFGFQKNIEKFIIDPNLYNSIHDLKDVDLDFIFICVPTPMLPDGNQDNSILLSVFEDLSLINQKAIKIIKSTVIPNTLKTLDKIYSNIVYNPEFLRERSA